MRIGVMQIAEWAIESDRIISSADIAYEFDVSADIARDAMRRLRRHPMIESLVVGTGPKRRNYVYVLGIKQHEGPSVRQVVKWLYDMQRPVSITEIRARYELNGKQADHLARAVVSCSFADVTARNGSVLTIQVHTFDRAKPRARDVLPQLPELLNKGYSQRQIAKMVGVSSATISRLCARHGLFINSPYVQPSFNGETGQNL